MSLRLIGLGDSLSYSHYPSLIAYNHDILMTALPVPLLAFDPHCDVDFPLLHPDSNDEGANNEEDDDVIDVLVINPTSPAEFAGIVD